MKARAGNSLTKWDFQITNKTDWVEMGFLNYKWESRFTIHQCRKLITSYCENGDHVV